VSFVFCSSNNMTAMEGRATFGLMDYVVFGCMLLISASIGVYYRFTGGRQKTAEVRGIHLLVTICRLSLCMQCL